MTSDLMPAPRAERVHREVVSFVRRSARMRPGQRQALAAHADRYLVPVPRLQTSTSVAEGATLDVAAHFGRQAPLIVEIGPGTGESLVPMAADRPAMNVVAFEVYTPAIARLVAALAQAAVHNVRVVQADAVAGLARLLPAESVDELWTFFPDPWPKPRHHKRRLVRPEFAALVATRLKRGGLWRLATDWPHYADQIRGTLDACPAFLRHDGDRADRPITRFEQRGRDAGRTIADVSYRRR